MISLIWFSYAVWIHNNCTLTRKQCKPLAPSITDIIKCSRFLAIIIQVFDGGEENPPPYYLALTNKQGKNN